VVILLTAVAEAWWADLAAPGGATIFEPTARYGHTDAATRSALAVRGAAASACGERTAAPRPSWSRPVSCR
jgi:hypothetical protein